MIPSGVALQDAVSHVFVSTWVFQACDACACSSFVACVTPQLTAGSDNVETIVDAPRQLRSPQAAAHCSRRVGLGLALEGSTLVSCSPEPSFYRTRKINLQSGAYGRPRPRVARSVNSARVDVTWPRRRWSVKTPSHHHFGGDLAVRSFWPASDFSSDIMPDG